jgi:hypothetical protein
MVIIDAGDGLRPILAEDTPEALVELMQRCWALDPDLRPTIHAIRDALTAEAAHLGPETTPPLPPPVPEGCAPGLPTGACLVPHSRRMP